MGSQSHDNHAYLWYNGYKMKPRKPLPRQKEPIKRYTRIRPISRKRAARSGKVGKMGIVRLHGPALAALRLECFLRDGYKCVDCHRPVFGSDEFFFHPYRAEMSHKRAKRNNGDTLDNVVTHCQGCHQKSHNAGGKPCPRKPVQ